MMIVQSSVVDPLRVMTVRGVEVSEGSTPSIIFRTVLGLLMIFYIFISSLSTRPDSYQMLDSEAVRYRLSGIAHYKFRKALFLFF